MFIIVRLVFAAAVAVSLGFVWTVGQSGLTQVNRNLCELWASLPLDAALYELFDAITKEAMPSYREAGYLPANWHMKLTSPDGRRAVLNEIDRIRPEYVKFIDHINRIIYTDYNYYMSSLQEVIQGGRMDLAQNLDKLKTTIEALPEASTLQTVRLIEPQLNDFKKLVEAESVWAGQVRDKIRQKRNELSQAKQQ
jgi:hypothetical protein